MHRIAKTALAAVAALALTGAGTAGAATHQHRAHKASDDFETVHLRLDPSSSQLASCMPGSRIDVYVDLTTDLVGYDTVRVRGRHLAPNRDYTVFLLEQAASPFGAAEYIGDITSDEDGNARNRFKLIAEEAFSSTIVDGKRVRAELNQMGAWFADPADDDFCLGKNSPVTPFDGDDEAGVQAFNSRNSNPLP
jgi:hypothetical protein